MHVSEYWQTWKVENGSIPFVVYLQYFFVWGPNMYEIHMRYENTECVRERYVHFGVHTIYFNNIKSYVYLC